MDDYSRRYLTQKYNTHIYRKNKWESSFVFFEKAEAIAGIFNI